MLMQHFSHQSGQLPQNASETIAAFLANPGKFIDDALAKVVITLLATWPPVAAPAGGPSVDPDELLDVAAAAVLLGVVKATIHDYVKRGVLFPHRMRPGGKLYFTRMGIMAALTANTRHDGQRKHARRANKKGQ